MGPESRWQLKDDFSYLMRSVRRHAPVEGGLRLQLHPVRGRQHRRRRSAAGRSRATSPYDAERSHDLADAVHEQPADLREHSGAGLTPRICRTTGRLRRGLTFNLGLRYDLQIGSFNEDVPELLGKIEDKLGRDGIVPATTSRSSRSRARTAATATTSARASAWRGIPANNGVTNIHAAYGIVLRQHADAAELRRADLAAGQADHDPATRRYPDPFGGRTREVVPEHDAADDHRRQQRPGQHVRAPVQCRHEPDADPRASP